MKIETHSERFVRLMALAQRRGLMQPGRALPTGHQWLGHDIVGRGSAPARRLRQIARQQAKAEAAL